MSAMFYNFGYYLINFLILTTILRLKNMSNMFFHAIHFNNGQSPDDDNEQPLELDTSNVINMSQMFKNATNFNQPIKFNDTSKVENMSGYV